MNYDSVIISSNRFRAKFESSLSEVRAFEYSAEDYWSILSSSESTGGAKAYPDQCKASIRLCMLKIDEQGSVI